MQKSFTDRGILVSVIIPVYNSEKWILDTVNSALNQTYENIEIIIIDDGSTDDTQNILSKFRNHSKVKIYKIKNSGPAAARNYGVTLSEGKLIAFLDSDDIWKSDKLEKQVKHFLNHDCHLLLTNIEIIDEYDNLIGRQEKKLAISNKDQVVQLFQGRVTQNTPTIMVKREVFNEFGGFNTALKHKEDHFFLMEVANKYKVEVLKEFLVLRRIWGASMSRDYLEFEKNPQLITKHFLNTRFPFYNLSLKKFPFLKDFLDEELSNYYNYLSHVLLMQGHLIEAKAQMKIAVHHKAKIKHILKFCLLYFPPKMREYVIKYHYK